MFSVNRENLVKNEFYICKEYHWPPSEIERMFYFDYEQLLEEIKTLRKQEEQERKKQEQSSGSYKPSMPSMPKLPKVSLPKI